MKCFGIGKTPVKGILVVLLFVPVFISSCFKEDTQANVSDTPIKQTLNHEDACKKGTSQTCKEYYEKYCSQSDVDCWSIAMRKLKNNEKEAFIIIELECVKNESFIACYTAGKKFAQGVSILKSMCLKGNNVACDALNEWRIKYE